MISQEVKDYGEFLAYSMKEQKRKHEAYVKQMYPILREKGEALRKIREGLCISRRAIAKKIGAAESVIMRLETGGCIQRRPVIEQSYRMAVKLIQYERREAAGLI